VITPGCKVIHVEADHLLRAGINAKITAFAVALVDFYPSLDGHLWTSKLVLDNWSIFTTFIIYI